MKNNTVKAEAGWEAHERGRGKSIAHMKDGTIKEVHDLTELMDLSRSGLVEIFEKVDA